MHHWGTQQVFPTGPEELLHGDARAERRYYELLLGAPLTGWKCGQGRGLIGSPHRLATFANTLQLSIESLTDRNDVVYVGGSNTALANGVDRLDERFDAVPARRSSTAHGNGAGRLDDRSAAECCQSGTRCNIVCREMLDGGELRDCHS
jgi:hypothetical protein